MGINGEETPIPEHHTINMKEDFNTDKIVYWITCDEKVVSDKGFDRADIVSIPGLIEAWIFGVMHEHKLVCPFKDEYVKED